MFSFSSKAAKVTANPSRVRSEARPSGFDGFHTTHTGQPAVRAGDEAGSWIDSTLDLKQGLDVVEMSDVPLEFFEPTRS